MAQTTGGPRWETRLRVRDTVAFEWRSFREAIAWLDMGVMAVYNRVIKTSPFGGVGATVAVMVVRGSMGERGKGQGSWGFPQRLRGRHGGCDGGGEENGGGEEGGTNAVTCHLLSFLSFFFSFLCALLWHSMIDDGRDARRNADRGINSWHSRMGATMSIACLPGALVVLASCKLGRCSESR